MRFFLYLCACTSVVLVACTKDNQEISKTLLSLSLQSGGSISSDTADDLYPQLVQVSNGTLTLFFVSNRATANGCNAGAYCIFVSQSVSTYTDGATSLPKFTDPVALNVSGTAVTSTNAQGIAAFYDNTVPAYKIVFSDNTNAVQLAVLPVANISTGTLQSAATAESGPAGARSGVVNGAHSQGGMYYFMGDGGARQRKIQTATTTDGGTVTCSLTDNCRWITYIRSAAANGIDFLHISADGQLYRYSGGASRAADSFNKMLAIKGLRLTGLTSLGHGNSDLLLVSANTGGQNDLYVLNTPIKTTVTVAGNAPSAGTSGAITYFEAIASRVYGQPGFTTGTVNNPSLSAASLSTPQTGMAADANGVYLNDFGNNRVLYFSGTSTVATRVYGQLGSFTTGTANNSGVSADSLSNPIGIAVDTTGVYIADYNNHRVLFYPGTSTTATRVYGQATMGANAQNSGGILATSLFHPSSIALDSTGVYIGDTDNHRVLFFPGTSTTATRVYGQSGSFSANTQNNAGPSAVSLRNPQSIYLDSTGVYIADTMNNRMLFFSGTSTTATRVYGQGTMSGVAASTSATGLNQPCGIASDGAGLYVTEQGNNRAVYFSGTSTTATRVYGQLGSFVSATANNGAGISATGFNTPTGILFTSSGLYVGDYNNSRVLFFAP